jgi:hypothetical protein
MASRAGRIQRDVGLSGARSGGRGALGEEALGEKRGVTQRASARTPGVADFRMSRTQVEDGERRGEIKRLTIVAGLVLGASLAVQSMLGAHARARIGSAASAVRVHVHEVAPWYVAMNDVVPGARRVSQKRAGGVGPA